MSDLYRICVHVTYGRGSVLLWQRSDMLCISGFTVKVARRTAETQCARSLGLGHKLCAVIPVAGQRTHGTTFRALKVTSQVATPGAESAIYDCTVAVVNTARF